MGNNHAVKANALYFPYIDVNYSAWMSQVLLYWDSVGSIMPEEYVANQGALGPEMRELIDAGLVKPIAPASYFSQLGKFADSFLLYIHCNASLPRRLPSRINQAGYRPKNTLLHLEKMGGVANALQELGLAKQAYDSWWEVEPKTANAFMFWLSSALGDLEDIDAVPITDERGALTVSSGQLPRRSSSLQSLNTTRESLVHSLFPAPSHAPNVDELLRFKQAYGHLLRRLRMEVESTSITLANITDPGHRSNLLCVKQAEFEELIEEIRCAMQARRWRDLNVHKILPILAAAPSVEQAITQPSTLHIAAAGASLAYGIYASRADSSASTASLESPLAYVAHARATFG